MKAPSTNQPAQVHQALSDSNIGPRLGVYFTIERVRNTRERISRFQTGEWSLDLDDVETIDDLVDHLRTEMENREIRVVRSTDLPNVIHLIEEPLVAFEDYVMDKRTDLAYSGKLSGLASALGEHVPGIGPQCGFAIPGPGADFRTEVEIEAKDQSVRQILTVAPPLEEYKHILWQAQTDLDGDWEVQTRVFFSGRKAPPRGDD